MRLHTRVTQCIVASPLPEKIHQPWGPSRTRVDRTPSRGFASVWSSRSRHNRCRVAQEIARKYRR